MVYQTVKCRSDLKRALKILAAELGRELNSGEIQKTTITLPKALYLRWRHAALDRGTTQRRSIIEALELWLAVGETPAEKPPGRKASPKGRQ